MKKKLLIGMMAAAVMMAMPVQAESLARFEGDSGNIDILGYSTTSSGNDQYLVALFSYENTKDESNAPWLDFMIKAYQDGVELERGYIYEYTYEDFKSEDTNVRPGATLKFFELFELTSDSPVDVEVSETFSFDDKPAAECTFDLSSEASDQAEAPADAAPADDAIAALEQRIADLEQRVSALENQ